MISNLPLFGSHSVLFVTSVNGIIYQWNKEPNMKILIQNMHLDLPTVNPLDSNTASYDIISGEERPSFNTLAAIFWSFLSSCMPCDTATFDYSENYCCFVTSPFTKVYRQYTVSHITLWHPYGKKN